MELPDAYDLSSVREGELLDAGLFTFLHAFFEEEGMALHLRSKTAGSEFYVQSGRRSRSMRSGLTVSLAARSILLVPRRASLH